jgi:tetratricopeptide (TPR) repeat protein
VGVGVGGGGWGLGGWGWPGYGFGSFGLGLGYGLSSWCYGSPYYYWGYEPYYNPYYSSAVIIQQPVYLGADTTTIYDYSQPLNTQAAPAVETDADQALDLFDQARDAFKAGQYQTALGLTDQALAKTPQDAALHEFRALTLFALGRFDDAAAVIYPVLAVGPGWNWATMIGLYPNVDVYTQQLRALEAFRVQHDNDPAPAFLLAYHYLTMGHKDNARAQLEAVVKLQPDDRIASQLLTQLTGKQPAVAPAAAPKLEDAGKQFAITGNWSATAGDGAETITLNIKDGGSFEWKVNQKGQARTLAGTSTLGSNGLLTLASNDAGVMVGQVRWSDPDHFNFRLVGAQGDDQGLNFTRAQ